MYANGNVYKEAGNAVAYCSLLYIHRTILQYRTGPLNSPGPLNKCTLCTQISMYPLHIFFLHLHSYVP
jgi:hypothetical protein